MIPYTTPTFIIKLIDAEGYLANTVSLRVDIRQQDVILSKDLEDVTIDAASNSIGIFLSQKESGKFLYKKGDIEFQVHGLLNDGTAWKTIVVEVPVKKTLTKEVIE